MCATANFSDLFFKLFFRRIPNGIFIYNHIKIRSFYFEFFFRLFKKNWKILFLCVKPLFFRRKFPKKLIFLTKKFKFFLFSDQKFLIFRLKLQYKNWYYIPFYFLVFIFIIYLIYFNWINRLNYLFNNLL